MSPATPWTEMTGTETPYVKGLVDQVVAAVDFFVDPLFEGTGLFALLPTSYSEMSISATAHTEMSVASTAWTKVSI